MALRYETFLDLNSQLECIVTVQKVKLRVILREVDNSKIWFSSLQ